MGTCTDALGLRHHCTLQTREALVKASRCKSDRCAEWTGLHHRRYIVKRINPVVEAQVRAAGGQLGFRGNGYELISYRKTGTNPVSFDPTHPCISSSST